MILSFLVPGGQEWFLLIAVIVLLFGASKLPRVMRNLGKSQVELEKGKQEAQEELEEMKQSTEENEVEDREEAATEEVAA